MPDEDRINVEYNVKSYETQSDGTLIVICTDGTRLRLLPDGSSEVIAPGEID